MSEERGLPCSWTPVEQGLPKECELVRVTLKPLKGRRKLSTGYGMLMLRGWYYSIDSKLRPGQWTVDFTFTRKPRETYYKFEYRKAYESGSEYQVIAWHPLVKLPPYFCEKD